MAMHSSDALIMKTATLDITPFVPRIGLDTGRCCEEAGTTGTNGSGRRTNRVAANDNGAASVALARPRLDEGHQNGAGAPLFQRGGTVADKVPDSGTLVGIHGRLQSLRELTGMA